MDKENYFIQIVKNESDFLWTKISDLFFVNSSELAQIIAPDMSEYIDDLPSWYEHILYGICYYVIGDKSLLSDLFNNLNNSTSISQLQQHIEKHYDYTFDPKNLQESLMIFSSRILGWRARNTFYSRANNMSNDELLDDAIVWLFANYIAEEYKRNTSNGEIVIGDSFALAQQISEWYLYNDKLHNRIVSNIKWIKELSFYQRSKKSINEDRAWLLDDISIDLGWIQPLLLDYSWAKHHPLYKKIVAEHSNEKLLFGFGINEKKFALTELPKYTKTLWLIDETIPWERNKKYDIHPIEIASSWAEVHIQPSFSLTSLQIQTQDQILWNIIPFKELPEILEGLHSTIHQYFFKKHEDWYIDNNSFSIESYNDKFVIIKDIKGDYSVCSIIAHDSITKKSEYVFLSPIADDYQWVWIENNLLKDIISSLISKYVYHYFNSNNENQYWVLIWEVDEIHKKLTNILGNFILFKFSELLDFFSSPYSLQNLYKALVVCSKSYKDLWLRTDIELREAKPVLATKLKKRRYSHEKFINKHNELFNLERTISENTILKLLNISHLLSYHPTWDQLIGLSDIYSNLVHNWKKTIDEKLLEDLTIERESYHIINEIGRIPIEDNIVRLIIWNIHIALYHKHFNIVDKLNKFLLIKLNELYKIHQNDQDYTKFLDWCIQYLSKNWSLNIGWFVKFIQSSLEEWLEVEREHQYLDIDYFLSYKNHYHYSIWDRPPFTNPSKYNPTVKKSPRWFTEEFSLEFKPNPSKLRVDENIYPLPMSYVPQIKNLIDHNLSLNKIHSSLLNDSATLIDDYYLLRQWFNFYEKKWQVLNFLGMVQHNKIYNKEMLRFLWEAYVTGSDNTEIQKDPTLELSLVYHCGFIEEWKWQLQELWKKMITSNNSIQEWKDWKGKMSFLKRYGWDLVKWK